MSDLSSEDEDGPKVSLTGFLFGNVDTKTGKLEDQSIFGLDSDRQIKALENLGLGFQTVLTDDEEVEMDDEAAESNIRAVGVDGGRKSKKERRVRFSYDSSDDESDEGSEENFDEELEQRNKVHESTGKPVSNSLEEDYNEYAKSSTAVDFSDISEFIEEEEDNFEELEYKTTFGAYNDLDKRKMPPPSALSAVTEEIGSLRVGLPTTSPTEKKLETPLASMLPSKYANVSVTKLFPDFRPDKVLRFSRLFGPGKFNSLPHTWRNARKRRRKKKERLLEEQNNAAVNSITIPGFDDLTSMTEKTSNQLILPSLNVTSHDRRNGKIDWETGYDEDEVPDPSLCVTDDEELFCRPHNAAKEGDESTKRNELGKPKPAEKKHLWRHGPAAIWFEMLGIPDNPDHFEYGFNKKTEEKDLDSELGSSDEEGEAKEKKPEVIFPDESFNMVTQADWEESIIWDSQDAKVKKLAKNKTAGWVPCGSNRSAQNAAKSQDTILPAILGPAKSGAPPSFLSSVPPAQTPSTSKSSKGLKATEEHQSQVDDTWYSIFPVETTELVNGHWEKDIIWDVDNVEEMPEPKVLELDPNDENIILCIPDDIDPNASQSTSTPVKVKIPHPHVKKSKILLGKAGVINVIEEDSPPPSPKDDDKDPYNLSLDEYYQAKHTEQALIKISTSGNIIQHSTPVVELRAPFIPTHMNLVKLRNFHRPALRQWKLSSGPTSNQNGPHSLLPLMKHIQRKAKQREAERHAAGGGDIFFMRTAEDFSGKDGELLLVEHCEEHPPLLNQVGMCSKIKNYYKRKTGKDDGPEDQRYGETVIAHTSPFLGAMHPGQMIQTLENNMYRSAIFPHEIRPTDFLVIRTRNSFFIRTFDTIFTAAQECPLYEVPGPNSKRANNFVRDFLQVFIYRLFWSSRDSPRRIRMDDIKKAFPMHSESSIRKRLKLCADFKRTGTDSNWWVIKPEFRLPTEEEIRAMVSPEQCCAYFSLVAAEQRLKDAGYGTQSILAPLPEDEDENEEKKLDDEVKVAPWNTTRSYIQAIKGKCILQINGPADPTGCGEGFSYVRMPNKPQTTVEEKETQPKRIVTGTDADLRRLSLNNAKALLRKFGVPEDEVTKIQKLSRWEVIDVVRTLSTEKAKAGEDGMNKFSRGNRFSVAEHQERYKEECQRIFELQNRVLQSNEILSTDEGESTEEEDDIEDIEEMGKNIEKMLSNKKTSSQLSHEKEEAERRDLQRMLMGEGKEEKEDEKSPRKKKKDQAKIDEDNKNLHGLSLHPGRVLKIQRKYKNAEGKEFTRNEIVRKSHIIDIYMRIRTTKDEQFIRQFALLDDQTKEEMKKEKRRIQEQLRRIKKNQEKEHISKPPPQRKKKIKMKPELKMKCGACGQVGHMRTNKACPYYEKNNEAVPSMNVAMTEEEEVAIKQELIDDTEELVKVDGTKVQLSTKLLKHAEDLKRRSLLLKVPKEAVAGPSKMKKKRNQSIEPHCDYLEGKAKSANRKRIDPQVVLSNMFEEIINNLRSHKDSTHFHYPVGPKIPRYHDIITTPMDLQTMREKNRQKQYQTRNDFYEDLKLLVDNSSLYNGETHQLTGHALKLFEMAESKLRDNEAKVWKLEKQINPLLDENDKKRMAYILTQIMEKVKVLPEALVFLKPVNKKTVKNYYDLIRNPIDLGKIEQRIHDGRYKSRLQFMADMELIHTNASTFNGLEHSVTKRALYVLDFTRALMKEFDKTLIVLEENIQHDEDYEERESTGRHHRSGSYQPESTNGSPEMEEDEPLAKRTRRVSSYYGPVSDEDEDERRDSSVYKRSASPDFEDFKVVKDSQQLAIEAMLHLSKSGSRASTGSHRGDTNRFRKQSIHGNEEVSDSNDDDDEEGEIHDDDD